MKCDYGQDNPFDQGVVFFLTRGYNHHANHLYKKCTQEAVNFYYLAKPHARCIEHWIDIKYEITQEEYMVYVVMKS
jgi:hypothetical protein